MRLYIPDSRRVGLILTRDDETYWWAVGGQWTIPFDPSRHVMPFTPRDPGTSIFHNLQWVELGSVLQTYPDAQVLYVLLDPTSGQPVEIEAVYASYAIAPYPTPSVWLVAGSTSPPGWPGPMGLTHAPANAPAVGVMRNVDPLVPPSR